MTRLLAILAAAVLSSAALAGEFEITGEDTTWIEVHYTGEVYRYDYLKWDAIEEYADGRVIILTLDTPGGSAYGGRDLFWEIHATDRVVTVAGEYGAWSAGAIMWMAGDHRIVPPGGQVGWHRAYCTWDPDPMPDIGCDVSPFDLEMDNIFFAAGYGSYFIFQLQVIQFHHGTDGWILVTHDGWYFTDTNEGLCIPADPGAIGVPPCDWSVL